MLTQRVGLLRHGRTNDIENGNKIDVHTNIYIKKYHSSKYKVIRHVVALYKSILRGNVPCTAIFCMTKLVYLCISFHFQYVGLIVLVLNKYLVFTI